MKCDICGRYQKHLNRIDGIGYCRKHYRQMTRYGRTLDVNPRTVMDRNDYVIDGDTARIFLYDRNCNKIAEAIVDTEDLDRVKHIKWKLSGSGYAMNSPKFRGGSLHMSRIILDTELMVDHINHNTLDNRKCNLRVVTKSQNQMNSDYRGVDEHSGKWYARIKLHGKALNLGTYVFREEAYFARWYAEKLLFGEYRYPKQEPEIPEDRKNAIMLFVERKVQRL